MRKATLGLVKQSKSAHKPPLAARYRPSSMAQQLRIQNTKTWIKNRMKKQLDFPRKSWTGVTSKIKYDSKLMSFKESKSIFSNI